MANLLVTPEFWWAIILAELVLVIAGTWFWAKSERLDQIQALIKQQKPQELRQIRQQLIQLNREVVKTERQFDMTVHELTGGWKGKLFWSALLKGLGQYNQKYSSK